MNPNTRNRNLWTPLHDCAVQGNARICTILLDAGSDVRARTRQNSTALHIACAKNHVDIVRCLLTRPHIEIDAVNNVGQTALVKCCEKGFEDLVCSIAFLSLCVLKKTLGMKGLSYLNLMHIHVFLISFRFRCSSPLVFVYWFWTCSLLR